MPSVNSRYAKLPVTDEELLLIADVAGVPVNKVRAIMEMALKAISDRGGYVLTGGKLTQAPNANAAWNMPIDAQDAKP
jgi:hypothetical protein